MTLPRTIFPPDTVLHVLNRGNERRELFADAADYSRFVELLAQTQRRLRFRLVAYAVMPNHWHLVAWPTCADHLSQFMHRLCWRHASELRHRTATAGYGHVYQGRYKAFAIRSPLHYHRVVRYVEANPLRAGLVARSEDWPWSSLNERLGSHRLICDGPQALPPPDAWLAEVNRPMTAEEITQARWRR